MKKYYSMDSSGKESEIYIFDDIVTPDEKAWRSLYGEDAPTSGFSLSQDIAKSDSKKIHVHINSYGGVVSEGLAIYNAIKQHPAEINTYSDGFCCSAAVLPFLAGDRRIASSASAFLFHQAMTGAFGNADEMRAVADELDMLTKITMGPYMSVTNISEDEMMKIFREGKMLSPEFVHQIGIATEIQTYQQQNKAVASAKGAFFAQFFKPESNQLVAPAVEIKITNTPEFQQWMDKIQQKIEQIAPQPPIELTPRTENNTMKFLNALLGGKE